MNRTVTGFVVPSAVAKAVIAQIRIAFADAPVWLPEVVELDDKESIICADKSIMSIQIRATQTLGDIPLTQELINQLGGWNAIHTITIQTPDPSGLPQISANTKP